jgi:predicted nucleic acid binding AN1-type Zn finger protein
MNKCPFCEGEICLSAVLPDAPDCPTCGWEWDIWEAYEKDCKKMKELLENIIPLNISKGYK